MDWRAWNIADPVDEALFLDFQTQGEKVVSPHLYQPRNPSSKSYWTKKLELVSQYPVVLKERSESNEWTSLKIDSALCLIRKIWIVGYAETTEESKVDSPILESNC